MTDQRSASGRRWPWPLSTAGILTASVVVAGIGIAALVKMWLVLFASLGATCR